MRRFTSEQAAKAHADQTEAWGIERRSFEPDGGYFLRVAAYWKERAETPAYVHVVEVFERDDGTYIFADLDDAIAFEDAVNGDGDLTFGSRCIRSEEVVCDHADTLKLIESEKEE